MKNKSLSLRKLYQEIVNEAHSVTDFPIALQRLIQLQVIEMFRVSETSSFERWTKEVNVSSFRDEEFVSLTNIGLMKKKNEGAGNKETSLSEVSYKARVEPYSNELTITRQMVVNDQLNAFGDLASAFVTAARDTQAELAITTLVSPGLAYNGNPFYSLSAHNNDLTYSDAGIDPFSTTINTANALVNARVQMVNQRDPFRPDRIVGVSPQYIICPPSYTDRLKLVLTSELVTDPVNDVLVANPARNMIPVENLIEEVRLESFTGLGSYIYLVANPQVRPAFLLSYLNANNTPQVYMKQSPLISVNGGGRSDFDYPFDDLTYVGALDFGFNVGEPLGVIRLQKV